MNMEKKIYRRRVKQNPRKKGQFPLLFDMVQYISRRYSFFENGIPDWHGTSFALPQESNPNDLLMSFFEFLYLWTLTRFNRKKIFFVENKANPWEKCYFYFFYSLLQIIINDNSRVISYFLFFFENQNLRGNLTHANSRFFYMNKLFPTFKDIITTNYVENYVSEMENWI